MPLTTALSMDDPQHIFDNIQSLFLLDPVVLLELTKAFLDEMKHGLSAYNHPMAMIPTFVKGVPDGTETGTFLALDLGGTNLRVCEIELHGNKKFTLRQQKYKVSEALKTGEATALFDYLADSVDAFLTSSAHDGGGPSPRSDDTLSLGLTFSFPVEQQALDSGVLLTWTKGFSAKNAAGQDVVKLLQNAFDRKHMHVKCVALVNDTTGALLSRAYTAGGCILGAIFGTGTNGAYVEEVANIKKLAQTHPEAVKIGGHMIVNTEWGAFNNTRSHLPSTAYDNALDRLSINPGFQAFEKFISGMYLGEITRLVLLSLIDDASTYSPRGKKKPLLFGGKGSDVMNKMWGVDTQYMSEVEDAWGEGDEDLPHFMSFNVNQLDEKKKARLEKVRKVVVDRFGYGDTQVGAWDAAVVRWACELVARRAAHLSAAAVAAILIQTGRAVLRGETGKPKNASEEQIVVGVDGSLIEHYPRYERTLRESLRGLIGEKVEGRVVIGMAKDGSGVGAALCALQALKQQPMS